MSSLKGISEEVVLTSRAQEKASQADGIPSLKTPNAPQTLNRQRSVRLP